MLNIVLLIFLNEIIFFLEFFDKQSYKRTAFIWNKNIL